MQLHDEVQVAFPSLPMLPTEANSQDKKYNCLETSEFLIDLLNQQNQVLYGMESNGAVKFVLLTFYIFTQYMGPHWPGKFWWFFYWK